ncbi:MAG TPA: UDP-N-acetylmuramate dehydrogenase [Polyangia bacterium]|nr:UDP-N-acetylmuramate dehydrogenase [Polyangia bacterium]
MFDRAALRALVRGQVLVDEPLARHTTLRIGGPVDALVAPADTEDCQRTRAFCHQQGVPCRALGSGSNLLVRDGGVRGVLITTKLLRKLERDGDTVRVGAGVATGKLLAAATRWELGGVEFLGGVPGTVGGGLVMNAGTYLGEFTNVTTEVLSVDPAGGLVGRDHDACGFVYRGSAIPETDVVVEGTLRLRPRPRADIEADVRELRERRRAREPHGVPNAGSIFKNPPGDYAGRLLEAAGLKGRKVGDAGVSPVHANWLVNLGEATAADMLALIELCRQEVAQKFGVHLELEVKVVGEDPEP